MIGDVSADLQLNLRTPIWTAGSNPQKMQRIEETGILGSLRWWHHILIHDSWNCKCEVKQEGDEKNICPTCWLFGTTGWRRRFNLRVDGDEGGWPRLERVPSANKKFWFIPLIKGNGGNDFLLRILNNGSPKYNETAGEIVFLLKLISRFGSIGGKKGSGNGVFRVNENGGFDVNTEVDNFLAKRKAYFMKKRVEKSIFEKDFFFIEFHCSAGRGLNERNLNYLSPAVRGYLRGKMRLGDSNKPGMLYDSGLREGTANNMRHELMGQASGNQTRGSSIIVSNPYPADSGQYRFRIYGLIGQAHRDVLPMLFKGKKDNGAGRGDCSLNFAKWTEIVNNGITEMNGRMGNKSIGLDKFEANDAFCMWDYKNAEDFFHRVVRG